MSKFKEDLLPSVFAQSERYTKNLKECYKSACKAIEDELHLLSKKREQGRKNKKLATLQSINENEVSASQTKEKQTKKVSNIKPTVDPPTKEERPQRASRTSKLIPKDTANEEDKTLPVRASRKRSKDEVEGLSSPEYDKRQKRNASVKAATVISKQVNVNLNQKMRREEPVEKPRESHSRRRKESDKENVLPVLSSIKIKQEKISLLPEPEPMEQDPLPLPADTIVKPEKELMPPPVVPMPKPRKHIPKEKTEDSEEESSTRRSRNTKNKKPAADSAESKESMLPPPVPSARSTRASSRATKQDADDSAFVPPPEPRPKRTRAKKKKSVDEEASASDKEAAPQENAPVSPTEQPRPKRTRRGKAAKQEAEKASESSQSKQDETPKPQEVTTPVETTKKQESAEKPTETEAPVKPKSPILQKEVKKLKSQIPRSNSKEQLKNLNQNSKEEASDKEEKSEIKSQIPRQNTKERLKNQKQNSKEEKKKQEVESEEPKVEETDVKTKITDVTVTLDKTVILPNGHCDHSPVMHSANRETVVIESHSRETVVIEKHKIMDSTVVIEKDSGHNMTEDDSLMTEDNSDIHTPPRTEETKPAQPTSAVKEKVQKFEEMATRTTRTKTRAQAKKEEVVENNQTPPDNSKSHLSAETLNKMHNLIFNGKPPQVSASATKPKNNVAVKSFITASASKAYGIAKAKEAMEDNQKSKERDRDDARKKKEAILEAKREEQKRKREEKMAAAAAMREAAEKNRQAALEQAAKERQEKQAHADQGKLERLKEVERKKHELARKVQETEERRRQEELARQQKLAEEQRKAEIARKKQQEELDAMRKEEAKLQKETEKRQKEYKEKQKLKQKLEAEKFITPSKLIGTPNKTDYKMDPVYMTDGFQYLNSDEESDTPPKHPIPEWSKSELRRAQLRKQAHIKQIHIDQLFSVRVHSVDLREIFPNVDRRILKRTSSAVWRTPPNHKLPTVNESPI